MPGDGAVGVSTGIEIGDLRIEKHDAVATDRTIGHERGRLRMPARLFTNLNGCRLPPLDPKRSQGGCRIVTL